MDDVPEGFVADEEVPEGFQPESTPQLPGIKLSPYQQYTLSGRERVAGPFGPANPQEVLALGEAAQRPFIPLPDTQAKGPLAAAYRSVIKPVVEGIESPVGVLMAPLLAESAPLRLAAGLGFGGMAAKSGLEKMQSDDPQTQLEGRMELAGAPLLALSGGQRDKVAPKLKAAPEVKITPQEAIPKIEEKPPSGEAGEAQPSAGPIGATVEAPVPAGETPQAMTEGATPWSVVKVGSTDLPKSKLKPNTIYVWGADWKGGRRTETLTTGEHTGDPLKGLSDYKEENPSVAPQVIMATDAQGNPWKILAPNRPEMWDFNSTKGQYMAGDLDAFRKDSLQAIEKGRQEADPEAINAAAQQRIDELNKQASDIQRGIELNKKDLKDAQSNQKAGKDVKETDFRFSEWKDYTDNIRRATKALSANLVKTQSEISKWESQKVKQAKVATATPEQPKQVGSVTQPVTEPQIQGMGGAVPSEFEVPQGTPTSTKNAVVDAERVKRGLPEAIQPARKEFGEVWDRAMARIDRDPEYPDNLINELEKRPRALTDEENATLLHRQVDLQNEYSKATRDLAQAFDDGRIEAMDSEKVRVSNLSDQLLRIYNIGKKVGTETGRGLNARKMLANEDFSLAKMTLDLRAAKGGSPLSPEQTLEIQRLHDKIAETQRAFDEHVSKSQVKISDLERQLGEQPRFTPPILKAAERIVSTLDTRANAARQRLKEKMTRFSAGVDPTIITDLAEIGASHIAHLGLDFAKWSTEMVKEFGDWVKPHLDEVWGASQKAIDSISGVPEEAKKAVKSAFSRLSDTEKEQATIDAVKEKRAQNKPDQITFYVQRLARDLVSRGVRDREKLIDAVHAVLQKAIPEISRRDTMDAISGYGDFRQLAKDDISVALRGMKGEMQQIAKLEDMAAGEPPLKSGTERRTPTDTERKLIKLVNDAKAKFQVPVQDPETQLKSALDTLKTTLTNRIKDYEERIAKGDYAPRERRELVLDPEASRLKAQNERVKKEFQKGVELERFKNSQPFERGAHWINKWRRGFILSSPVTLAKLTSAAAQRMVFTPTEEAVGSGIGALFPELAKRAPREGGFSPSAETLAITRGMTEGMKDAWDLLRTGQSDLDALYGKTSALPGSFLDFFGRLHGALKSTTKRAEFTRSLQKRIEFGKRNGVDVTDPWVQMKMSVEAYKDANRSIFLQDNRVVSAYRRFIGALEQKSKVTGEVPVGGKAAATAARVLIPIVKVPTNIVAETLQYALGSVTGGVRLARAYAKGIENLKPEEADLIMRELKKGSIGTAVMLLGYFNPNAVGGYYQRGEKRKPGEAKVASLQLYGVNIPSFLLHNPLLETLQIGATIRRVAEAHTSKKDVEKKGIGEGVYAAGKGLIEEVPFVREMTEVTKAFDPTQKNAFWGELGKSLLVPQLVQWIATHQDTDSKGNPIKRAPKTTVQHLETGIPGLREKVPKKKGQ